MFGERLQVSVHGVPPLQETPLTLQPTRSPLLHWRDQPIETIRDRIGIPHDLGPRVGAGRDQCQPAPERRNEFVTLLHGVGPVGDGVEAELGWPGSDEIDSQIAHRVEVIGPGDEFSAIAHAVAVIVAGRVGGVGGTEAGPAVFPTVGKAIMVGVGREGEEGGLAQHLAGGVGGGDGGEGDGVDFLGDDGAGWAEVAEGGGLGRANNGARSNKGGGEKKMEAHGYDPFSMDRMALRRVTISVTGGLSRASRPEKAVAMAVRAAVEVAVVGMRLESRRPAASRQGMRSASAAPRLAAAGATARKRPVVVSQVRKWVPLASDWMMGWWMMARAAVPMAMPMGRTL